MSDNPRAVVHVSGTLLRRAWYGKEDSGVIVVRPAGDDRDNVAYVVRQARFDGPTEMIYDVVPQEQGEDRGVLNAAGGYKGALPGFDGAVMVYVEAEEDSIHVQPTRDADWVSFGKLRQLVEAGEVRVPVLDPRVEMGC